MFLEVLVSIGIIAFFVWWLREDDSSEQQEAESIEARRRRWAKELYQARELQLNRGKMSRARKDVADVESDAEFYHVLDCNGFDLDANERQEMEAWRKEGGMIPIGRRSLSPMRENTHQ